MCFGLGVVIALLLCFASTLCSAGHPLFSATLCCVPCSDTSSIFLLSSPSCHPLILLLVPLSFLPLLVPGVTAPHFVPAQLKVRWVVMSPRPPLRRSACRDDLLERPWGRYSPFIVHDVIYVGGWLEAG